MDKLSQFYVDLSTNAEKMNQFNLGSNDSEIRINREKMLSSAGINNAEKIIDLNHNELQDAIALELSKQTAEWSNLAANADNNDNKVCSLGR